MDAATKTEPDALKTASEKKPIKQLKEHENSYETKSLINCKTKNYAYSKLERYWRNSYSIIKREEISNELKRVHKMKLHIIYRLSNDSTVSKLVRRKCSKLVVY